MEEVWKCIIGYEGKYQVSNLGNVRSLNYQGHGYVRNLVPKVNNRGRLWVELRGENGVKQMLIHRLVGESFIPNPNNLPEINHKDENPKNNCVDNLEWCTGLYNKLYSIVRHPERRTQRKHSQKYRNWNKVAIIQADKSGNEIRHWGNMREIANTLGYNQTSITECCEGKRHTAYGFKWQFAI